MPPLLKRFPGIMQSANRSLQHLRMHLSQMRELLLSLGQIVLLPLVGRERFISRNDVFPLQRASVYRALPRSNPVFELAQGVVIHASARLKPLQQFSLLRGIWINAVSVVHGQHVSILPRQACSGKTMREERVKGYLLIRFAQSRDISSPCFCKLGISRLVVKFKLHWK
jgi:hypothetical protein